MYGKIHALDGLDLTAKEGSILAVLGPNGAGKTTAVRILTTLSRPDSGCVVVAGRRDCSLCAGELLARAECFTAHRARCAGVRIELVQVWEYDRTIRCMRPEQMKR
jgi:ABC-type branched-subunit amino acid transport system ATPase component